MTNDQMDMLCKESVELIHSATLAIKRKPDVWVFQLPGEPALFFLPMKLPGNMLLTGSIFNLPDERRQEFYDLILLGNSVNGTVDGSSFGISEPDGELTMSMPIPFHRLAARSLVARLTRFREVRKVWAAAAARWPQTSDETSADQLNPLDNADWLRG